MNHKQPSRLALAAAVAATFVSASAFADARVRIAHFAPFADIREETSVTIAVDGEPILENVVFGDFSEYLDLAAGTYDITVTATGAADPAIAAEATVADGVDYTLAAIGNGTEQPLELLALEDDNTAAAAGNLKIRVVHAAPFADTPESTAVSIRADDGTVIGGLDSVSYRDASDILEVPAGTYDLKVATPDGRVNLIDAAPVDLPEGASVTIFATGDSTNEPLALVAVPVGELAAETPVDDRYAGHWYNPETPGQGFGFHPVPGADRMFATWYTYGEGGAPIWYALDTCATPGSLECNTTGFDGDTATFSVAYSTGGTFDEPGGVSAEAIGELVVEFTSCTTATATYTLNETQTGSFDLVNLTPVDSCTD
jgi:hypothetical protein